MTMGNKRANVLDVVEARYPGLPARVRAQIEAAERKFSPAPAEAESYLWEHTTHVAALAFDLARAEQAEPVAAAVAALFHDAGKFAGGAYHEGARPEEEESARLAQEILGEAGMKPGEVRRASVSFCLPEMGGRTG